MIDWTASMQQTFEYYTVDPGTWKDIRKLTTVRSCTINRDASSETLGSATIDTTETLEEGYIRVYLIANQNGFTEKHPLGTFQVQTPTYDYDGKKKNSSLDAYTPLLELKEKLVPLGFYIPKEDDILKRAYDLTSEYSRAPSIKRILTSEDKLVKLSSNFVADPNDSWLVYLTDLIANANYTFALDELGQILFSPKQDVKAMQPVWTYTDDNSSILQPKITMDRDLYGIPNRVEVVYSALEERKYYSKIAENTDPNSPTSIPSRGRVISYRDTNPALYGDSTEAQIQVYAEQKLRELSSVEYTISYTHGYCPVRLGDCVRMNYNRADLRNIKAKVISQSIKCEPGCPVTEKAIFTTNLWR